MDSAEVARQYAYVSDLGLGAEGPRVPVRGTTTGSGDVLGDDLRLDDADILAVVNEAHGAFVSHSSDKDKTPQALFASLLRALLEMTNSSYGFIGEILKGNDEARTPYLQTRAITNIAWTDEFRALYEANRATGFKFTNLNTLFGLTVRAGDVIISNDAPSDERGRGGVPDGHPPLMSYLGLPFRFGGELVGMVGVANRPSGYDESIVRRMQPVMTTLGTLIHGYRLEQQRADFESQLTDANALLKRRVAERTRELEALNAELRREVEVRKRAQLDSETAAHAKSRFLANMSHEIRTPLSGSVSLLEVLSKTDLNPEQLEMVSLIQGSSHTLRTVVDSILDFTKLEENKMTLKYVDVSLAAVMRHSTKLYRHLASNRDVALDAALPKRGGGADVGGDAEGGSVVLSVKTDPVRLGQVCSNLCSNAIKFARSRVHVVLSTCEPGQAAHLFASAGLSADGSESGDGTPAAAASGVVVVPWHAFMPGTRASTTSAGAGTSGAEVFDATTRFEVKPAETVAALCNFARLPAPKADEVMALIEVIDDGEGIGNEVLLNLFDAFVQGPSVGGSGKVETTDDGSDVAGIAKSRGSAAAAIEPTAATSTVETAAPHDKPPPSSAAAPGGDTTVRATRRLPPSHTGTGTGTGLGLSICKELAPLLGGRLLVASKEGVGSVFALLLPFALGGGRPRSASATAAESPTSKDGGRGGSAGVDDETLPAGVRRLQFAVVDDNKVNLKVINMQLKRLGVPQESITKCWDGHEAVDLVAAAVRDGKPPVDAMLMDQEMGIMNGDEATRQILKLCREADPPVRPPAIVSLTANVFAEEELGDVGFSAFLTKPTRLATLAGVLSHVLKDRADASGDA